MPAKLVLIMGVSGTGKSTIALEVAKLMNYNYLDADNFHSPKAKRMMANGEAIDDEIRREWIANMLFYLSNEQLQDEEYVLAYSGLKRHQREMFKLLESPLVRIMLHGEQSVISSRIGQRESHFFNIDLLDSQFEALELPLPTNNENITLIDVDQPIESIVNQTIQIITEQDVTA